MFWKFSGVLESHSSKCVQVFWNSPLIAQSDFQKGAIFLGAFLFWLLFMPCKFLGSFEMTWDMWM